MGSGDLDMFAQDVLEAPTGHGLIMGVDKEFGNRGVTTQANQARRSVAVCFQSGNRRSRRPLP